MTMTHINMDYDRQLFKRIAEALQKKYRRRCIWCKEPHDMDTGEPIPKGTPGEYTDTLCDKALAAMREVGHNEEKKSVPPTIQ